MSLDPPRTGARSPRLVPNEIRVALEGGAPSVNHMEQMAIDMGVLLANAFPELAQHSERLCRGGLVVKMRAGGEVLFETLGEAAWKTARKHRSDSVRGWGAMAIGACPGFALDERLDLVRPFADDPHFAVREWAWLAVRPHVIDAPLEALGLLSPLTASPSPRLRRFASEATRPRGVWSAHIPILKEEPKHGASLLEQLRRDPSTYVQNSVGNWLNDASKSDPQWVREICEAWLAEGEAAETKRICVRGMRTLKRTAAV